MSSPKGEKEPNFSSVQAVKELQENHLEGNVYDCHDENDVSCGWLSYRPACLSCLNTPKWLLIFLCQYFLCQSITVNGLYSVSISTLEKRFGFSSTLMGTLTSVYDIAALFLNFTLAYLGQSRKKSSFLSVGLLTLGLGMLVFILPHFMTGNYEAGEVSESTDIAVCPLNHTKSNECETTGGANLNYAVFIIGMALMGIGASPMLVLGLPYLDENVKPTVSSMYVGIFLVSGIIGAGIGFILAGIFLGMYVDIGVDTTLTPQDERWVGNWWIGYLLFGIVAILSSLGLSAFPKVFPGTKRMRENVKASGECEDIPPTGHSGIKDIPSVIKRLLTTPSYTFMLFVGSATWFIITALTLFLPKILQVQYRLPAQTVSFIYGVVSVPAAVLGQLGGSYVIKRFRLSGKQCMLVLFVTAVTGSLAVLFFFVSCDNVDFAGVNTPYSSNSSSLGDVLAGCNSECFCGSLAYDPVCGSDEISYFSACHAGCSLFSNKSYSDCSCIVQNMTSSGTAVHGLCQPDCGVLPVFFMIIFFVYAFVGFFSETPTTIATFRCVPYDQRAAGLGLQLVLTRALGTIPGPILVGMLIDSTCRLWENRCGEEGSCLEYHNGKLLQVVISITVASQAVIALFSFLAWKFYPVTNLVKTVGSNDQDQITQL